MWQHCVARPRFVYPRASVHGHLCFHLLNTGVQISAWVPAFINFECTPRSGITEPYGTSMFNILGSRHTVFHSGWTVLHSYQQGVRVPISPHPLQHFFFPLLF